MTYFLILTMTIYYASDNVIAEFPTLEACQEAGQAWLSDMEHITGIRAPHDKFFVCERRV